MIETHESAKLNIPAGIAMPGEYAWGFAYSRLFVRWFHVVAMSKFVDEGFQEHRNLFLTHIDDLVALTNSSEWEIKEVSLVSPSYMNKTGHWQMELLDKIFREVVPDQDYEATRLVFVTATDKRYTDLVEYIDEISTDNQVLIYQSAIS